MLLYFPVPDLAISCLGFTCFVPSPSFTYEVPKDIGIAPLCSLLSLCKHFFSSCTETGAGLDGEGFTEVNKAQALSLGTNFALP